MVGAVLLTGALALTAAGAPVVFSDWPPVAAIDPSGIRVDDFTDDELDLPFHLTHFHEVAGSVLASGENRGFIDIAVWRAPRHNAPYNARIMENVVSLAYFYATQRPWNPYYAAPAVRVRLEAALDFWCRKQHVDGRFSEYGNGEWGLAPTAFATKFMGETLWLLKNGPPIDPALHARVIAADRKAIEAVLTLPVLYDHGKDFANQYTNVYAGGLAYLDLYPDADLEARLLRSMRDNEAVFQSPAGYFYEQKGPDYSYNLGTHQSNLRMSLFYAAGTPTGAMLLGEAQRFFEWLAYNTALEPDGEGYSVNRGIETRQRAPYVNRMRGDRRGSPPREVTAAYPFLPTHEEMAEATTRERDTLRREWPKVPDLDFDEGSTFSPYTFLHRRHPRYFPTRAERDAAVAALPYLARARFVHQRMDSREPLVFTYVRRPAYYAAFNAGRRLMEQQRYGLGLVWTRADGAVLQSQTGSAGEAWGTRPDGAAQVLEAGNLAAEVLVGDGVVAAASGSRDLPEGPLTIRYPLGERGSKLLAFGETDITVTVAHPGPFREQLPFLTHRDDDVRAKGGTIEILRGGRPRLRVTLSDTKPCDISVTSDAVGRKYVTVVSVPAQDRLTYTFTFLP